MTDAILSRFALPAPAVSCVPFGHGHINQTYRVECAGGEAYILQRINTAVFHDPEALMRNIALVTAHLKKRAKSRREVLTLVPARDGRAYVTYNSAFWRMYEFVEDSICLERADTKESFRASAEAFGGFVNLLSDFDACLLTETIPHFHDTPARFEALWQAVDADTCGRRRTAQREIEQARSFAPFSHTLTDLQRDGRLPMRVTHNDTKINNVLFDQTSGRAVCVVDLDTVMPGLIVNDFGDAIRFGASTAPEDEQDLGRVRLDLSLYDAYLGGYLDTCGASLCDLEKQMLPTGAKMMTVECGVRFLTDYLAGDTYFHTDYPLHNLHRARTQLKLAADMDEKWPQMIALLQARL